MIEYEKPELSVIVIDEVDVICTSSGVEEGTGLPPGDSTEWHNGNL